MKIFSCNHKVVAMSALCLAGICVRQNETIDMVSKTIDPRLTAHFVKKELLRRVDGQPEKFKVHAQVSVQGVYEMVVEARKLPFHPSDQEILRLLRSVLKDPLGEKINNFLTCDPAAQDNPETTSRFLDQVLADLTGVPSPRRLVNFGPNNIYPLDKKSKKNRRFSEKDDAYLKKLGSKCADLSKLGLNDAFVFFKIIDRTHSDPTLSVRNLWCTWSRREDFPNLLARFTDAVLSENRFSSVRLLLQIYSKIRASKDIAKAYLTANPEITDFKQASEALQLARNCVFPKSDKRQKLEISPQKDMEEMPALEAVPVLPAPDPLPALRDQFEHLVQQAAEKKLAEEEASIDQSLSALRVAAGHEQRAAQLAQSNNAMDALAKQIERLPIEAKKMDALRAKLNTGIADLAQARSALTESKKQIPEDLQKVEIKVAIESLAGRRQAVQARRQNLDPVTARETVGDCRPVLASMKEAVAHAAKSRVGYEQKKSTLMSNLKESENGQKLDDKALADCDAYAAHAITRQETNKRLEELKKEQKVASDALALNLSAIDGDDVVMSVLDDVKKIAVADSKEQLDAQIQLAKLNVQLMQLHARINQVWPIPAAPDIPTTKAVIQDRIRTREEALKQWTAEDAKLDSDLMAATTQIECVLLEPVRPVVVGLPRKRKPA